MAGPIDKSENQTRRFLGGRQPLCGIGVMSVIERTRSPAACSERTADSRPGPGPLMKTSASRMPTSSACLAAWVAANCAAYGVLLREPLNPEPPVLDQARVLPWGSVIVTIVLLKVD